MDIAKATTELLNQFQMIEVLKVVSEGPEQYSVLFRVRVPETWTQVVGELLRVEEVLGEDSPFTLHLCRQYVRHEGALRYVAHMTVQGSQGLEEALGGLNALLTELQAEGVAEEAEPPPKPAQAKPAAKKRASRPKAPSDGNPNVQTVPLIRSSSDRNQPRAGLWKSGSRGAHLIRGQQ